MVRRVHIYKPQPTVISRLPYGLKKPKTIVTSYGGHSMFTCGTPKCGNKAPFAFTPLDDDEEVRPACQTCRTIGEAYDLTTIEIDAAVKKVEANIKRRLQCKYFEELQRLYRLHE
jgi:hypothetical protein